MVWKLIRRNVVSKPFRFLLTASAVTIGVMFTVGVFVFTDSLRATFGDLADDIESGFDLAVRSEVPFGERFDAPPVPVGLEDEVIAVDGVVAVQPRILKFNTIPIDGNGEEETGQGPNIGVNWEDATPTPRLFLAEGRPPEGRGEFVMDIDTFADGAFELGGTFTVVTFRAGPVDMELVGTFNFASPEENLVVGAKILAFDTPTALEVLNGGAGYDDMTVVVEGGADVDQVTRDLQAVIPPELEVVTQELLADEQQGDFDEVINTFRTVLLVFAFIILAVSAFVIYNVFTILIGQRIRELGLLRAVGATGRQVTTALLGEAALVGVAATVIGTGAGIGLGWSLRWLLQRLDFGPSGNDLLLQAPTFIWGAVVGLGVTMASAIVPAFRARDVSPMAALRDDARLTQRTPAPNSVLGMAAIAAGVALVVLSFTLDELDLGVGTLPGWALIMAFGVIAAFLTVFGVRRFHARAGRFALLGFGLAMLVLALVLDLGTGKVLSLIAVAAVTMFLGVATVSPMLARPAADFLGRWPLSILVGIAGVLVTLVGGAAVLGSIVLIVISTFDLITDADLAGLYGLIGSVLLVAPAVALTWVGVRSVDASFILGWPFWRVVFGVITFVLGAIGVVLVVTGLTGPFTGEPALSALILVGGVLLGGAWALRRSLLPQRMKSNARMARENAARSPHRTASAAAALMIGLALVSTSSVVAESFKATFASILEESVKSDWFITGDNFNPNAAFSTTLADDIEELDEVDTVVRYRFSLEPFRTSRDGTVRDSSATDLLLSLDHIDPDFVELDESLINRQAAFVHRDFANDNGYEIGSVFDVEFVDRGVETLQVAGIFTDSAIYGNRVVGLDLWADHFPTSQDQFLSVTTSDGVSEEQARAAIESRSAAYPQLTVDTRDEFQERQEGQIDQFLTVINVLLLVAVVIALLGIAITLALSVFERTRELGLVRAVGMTSRQMMRMVLFEGAIIAAFGGVLGVGLGLVFGAAAVMAIPDSFIDTLGVSVPALAQYVAVAAVAGIGAAIVPARRASRLDILDAIAQE